MNTIRHYISAAALLLIAFSAGCTHNNGDIGTLFGQWRLTGMTCDGADLMPEGKDVYWAFQSTTVKMVVILPYHERSESYGSWRLDDNTLFMDFSDDRWSPPAEMRLPRQSALQVLKLDGGRMQLSYTPEGDNPEPIVYTLKKW